MGRNLVSKPAEYNSVEIMEAIDKWEQSVTQAIRDHFYSLEKELRKLLLLPENVEEKRPNTLDVPTSVTKNDPLPILKPRQEVFVTSGALICAKKKLTGQAMNASVAISPAACLYNTLSAHQEKQRGTLASIAASDSATLWGKNDFNNSLITMPRNGGSVVGDRNSQQKQSGNLTGTAASNFTTLRGEHDFDNSLTTMSKSRGSAFRDLRLSLINYVNPSHPQELIYLKRHPPYLGTHTLNSSLLDVRHGVG